MNEYDDEELDNEAFPGEFLEADEEPFSFDIGVEEEVFPPAIDYSVPTILIEETNGNTLSSSYVEKLWRTLSKGGQMVVFRPVLNIIKVPVLQTKMINRDFKLTEDKKYVIFTK